LTKAEKTTLLLLKKDPKLSKPKNIEKTKTMGAVPVIFLGGILFPKATVMIITHRDTILEAMDRVFVLHDKQFSDGMSVQELHENEAFKTLFSYYQRGF